MTFCFQGGSSSSLAKQTGNTVPRQSRHNSNTNPTRAANASGEKRKDGSEEQDPHKSPQRNPRASLQHCAPSAHNRSSERYLRRPDRDSNAGPTA